MPGRRVKRRLADRRGSPLSVSHDRAPDVLGEEQAGLRHLLPTGDIARVLAQPITLRDRRREIHFVMQSRRKRAAGGETR